MTSKGKPGITQIVRSRGTMAHGLLERALRQISDIIKQQASEGKSREDVERAVRQVFHQLVTRPESERNLLYVLQHVAVPQARAKVIALQRQANPKFDPAIHQVSAGWVWEEACHILVQLFEDMFARVLLAGHYSLYERLLDELLQLPLLRAKVYCDPARHFELHNPVGYLYAVSASYKTKRPLAEILAKSGPHQLAHAAIFMKRLEKIGGEASGQFLAQLGAANSGAPLPAVPVETTSPAPSAAPVPPAVPVPTEPRHTLVLTLTPQQLADVKLLADQLSGPAQPGQTTLPDRLLLAIKNIATRLRKQ